MTFRVGQRVVCVNADPRALNPVSRDWYPGEEPVEGEIYTIKRCFRAHGLALVWLAEICRAPIAFEIYDGLTGYAAVRFRPLVERKTSIEIFTNMLNPANQPQPEMEPV
ncbi:hypothetical protein [Bosea sp. LjRoot237]|uniref:hypothetical protein n=1 Tax=Bosea sp. LjRoot237 TaxID=3342292 RepID=UPI003ECE6625